MLRIRLSRTGALLPAVIVAACAPPTPIPPPVAAAPAATVATTPTQATAPARRVTLATAPDQFMTRDGVRLRYRDIGSGEPVILLHGASRTLADWEGIGDSLALTHRVIVPDQRGHGQSTKYPDAESYGWAMAADIERLLDHLRLDRAHLIGHSMGAMVASGVASRYPNRVATATLIAGPFYRDSATFATTLAPHTTAMERGEGFVSLFKWLFPGIPDSIARGISAQAVAANDMPSITAVFRSTGAMIVTPAMAARIRVPLLLAVGGGDPLAAQSRDMATWWPGARLLEIAAATHGTIPMDPLVLPAIREHLRAGKR